MNNRTHRVISGKRPWQGFIALAFMALVVVLIQPICKAYDLSADVSRPELITTPGHDAAESSHHAGNGGPCCSAIEEASLADRGMVLATSANEALAFPIDVPRVIAWSVDGRGRGVKGPGWRHPAAAPPPPHYFARSARILV